MRRGQSKGFGLVELMLALLLGAVLATGLLQVVQASMAAARLQQQLSALQEDARYALASISAAVRPAGFQPQPWLGSTGLPAITPGTRFEMATGATCWKLAAVRPQLLWQPQHQHRCAGYAALLPAA